MPDIMLVLSCLSYELDKTSQRRLGRIVEAMLSLSGRITMRGLSRWSDRGGSYPQRVGPGDRELPIHQIRWSLGVLVPVLSNQPHRPFPYFRGISFLLFHHPIFSRLWSLR